jgi:hypothetical protein
MHKCVCVSTKPPLYVLRYVFSVAPAAFQRTRSHKDGTSHAINLSLAALHVGSIILPTGADQHTTLVTELSIDATERLEVSQLIMLKQARAPPS